MMTITEVKTILFLEILMSTSIHTMTMITISIFQVNHM